VGVKVCILANWPIRPADGVLVHCRVTPFPRIKFASTHLNNRAERGIAVRAREKCLDQEHNTMSPTRSRTQTARSGVECANHGATATPLLIRWQDFNRVTTKQSVAHLTLENVHPTKNDTTTRKKSEILKCSFVYFRTGLLS